MFLSILVGCYTVYLSIFSLTHCRSLSLSLLSPLSNYLTLSFLLVHSFLLLEILAAAENEYIQFGQIAGITIEALKMVEKEQWCVPVPFPISFIRIHLFHATDTASSSFSSPLLLTHSLYPSPTNRVDALILFSEALRQEHLRGLGKKASTRKAQLVAYIRCITVHVVMECGTLLQAAFAEAPDLPAEMVTALTSTAIDALQASSRWLSKYAKKTVDALVLVSFTFSLSVHPPPSLSPFPLTEPFYLSYTFSFLSDRSSTRSHCPFFSLSRRGWIFSRPSPNLSLPMPALPVKWSSLPSRSHLTMKLWFSLFLSLSAPRSLSGTLWLRSTARSVTQRCVSLSLSLSLPHTLTHSLSPALSPFV